MLSHPIDVELRNLLDSFIEIEDTGRPVDVLRRNRKRAAFIRIERDPKGFFQSGEVGQVKPVRLLTLSGRWNLYDFFELVAPVAKMANARARADDSYPDIPGLFCLRVWPIQEKTILRMRTVLPEGELELRFVKMFDLERGFWKFHAAPSSSSLAGRPKVLRSVSSSSASRMSGSAVLTGDENSTGAASRTTAVSEDIGNRM